MLVQLKVARNRKYQPKWSRAFDHILIHTGAASIVNGLSKALGYGSLLALSSQIAGMHASHHLQRYSQACLGVGRPSQHQNVPDWSKVSACILKLHKGCAQQCKHAA